MQRRQRCGASPADLVQEGLARRRRRNAAACDSAAEEARLLAWELSAATRMLRLGTATSPGVTSCCAATTCTGGRCEERWLSSGCRTGESRRTRRSRRRSTAADTDGGSRAGGATPVGAQRCPLLSITDAVARIADIPVPLRKWVWPGELDIACNLLHMQQTCDRNVSGRPEGSKKGSAASPTWRGLHGAQGGASRLLAPKAHCNLKSSGLGAHLGGCRPLFCSLPQPPAGRWRRFAACSREGFITASCTGTCRRQPLRPYPALPPPPPPPQLSLPPLTRLQADGHGGREETRISAPLSAAVTEDRECPGGRRPAAAGCRAGCGLGPARRHTSRPTNSGAAAHRGDREQGSG